MHTQLLELAADLARREAPFVLAVVVWRQPASSAQAGDMALITDAGHFHGWLGGSCIQPTVVREARRAIADGTPRLIALSPDPQTSRWPGAVVFPMTCHSGGSVEIYLEPILPAARLVVFGLSPTARALVKVGKAMGYVVYAIGLGAEPALFPEADHVMVSLVAPELTAAATRGPCFAVVATMGEQDEDAIRAALALRPAYVGVVASTKRFAQIRQTLVGQGVTAVALDAIRSPAGVAIGAQTPEEIAVSVLAEIVERRHAKPTAPATVDALTPEPATAIDPICGMTVEIAGARHTAEHGGRTFYFCCGGCRERFLAAPDRYATVVSAT
jgi:xanthine dehydrogenase accessory factor